MPWRLILNRATVLRQVSTSSRVRPVFSKLILKRPFLWKYYERRTKWAVARHTDISATVRVRGLTWTPANIDTSRSLYVQWESSRGQRRNYFKFSLTTRAESVNLYESATENSISITATGDHQRVVISSLDLEPQPMQTLLLILLVDRCVNDERIEGAHGVIFKE